MDIKPRQDAPFSIAVQNEALWKELWAAATEGDTTVSDLLQMFNGDLYFAAGSSGALDPQVVEGVFRFMLPVREVLRYIGHGLEYDHYPDMFKADESGVDALCRMAGTGELYEMATGETAVVISVED